MAGFQSFDDFFDFYLREHSRQATRSLHFAGTTLSLVLVLLGVGQGRPWLFAAALVSGYAFAWVSHFFIEKNRPATFKYPLRSFAADWKMWALILSGRLGPALEKAGVKA
jgi:hypothetical protein